MYDESHVISNIYLFFMTSKPTKYSIKGRDVDKMSIDAKVWCHNMHTCEEVYTHHHDKRDATTKASEKCSILRTLKANIHIIEHFPWGDILNYW